MFFWLGEGVNQQKYSKRAAHWKVFPFSERTIDAEPTGLNGKHSVGMAESERQKC